MKSYNMTVDESINIVDKFNAISNKYAVSASDIGDMLSKSVSSLSVAGNTLDQAIAMGTAITEITGDAAEAGKRKLPDYIIIYSMQITISVKG